VHETGAKLEDTAEEQVEDKGPFATVAIGEDAKDDLGGEDQIMKREQGDGDAHCPD